MEEGFGSYQDRLCRRVSVVMTVLILAITAVQQLLVAPWCIS